MIFYRKYVNSFPNKMENVIRAMQSVKKHKNPNNSISDRNAVNNARTKDGFLPFLSWSSHALFEWRKKYRKICENTLWLQILVFTFQVDRQVPWNGLHPSARMHHLDEALYSSSSWKMESTIRKTAPILSWPFSGDSPTIFCGHFPFYLVLFYLLHVI